MPDEIGLHAFLERGRSKEQLKLMERVEYVELPIWNKRRPSHFPGFYCGNCKYLRSRPSGEFNYWCAEFDFSIEFYGCCFPKDTLVLGDNKNIQNYVKNDVVFDGTNETNVVGAISHNFTGEMINLKAQGMLPLLCTPEHPILTVKRRYSSTYQYTFDKPLFTKANEVECFHVRRQTSDYLLIPRLKGKFNDDTLFFGARDGDNLPLNQETAWLFGLYVAEGWTSNDRCYLSLNAKTERNLADKVVAIAKQAGLHASYHIIPSRPTIVVEIYSTKLAYMFREWCGNGAINKKIPESILLHNNLDLVKSFIDGYIEGDGCIVPPNPKNQSYGSAIASTISKTLALQLQLAYARLGTRAMVTKCSGGKENIMGRKVRIHDLYRVRAAISHKTCRNLVHSDYILYPVEQKTTTNFDGPVFNLETESQTYLVSNAIVHNCRFWRPEPSLMVSAMD